MRASHSVASVTASRWKMDRNVDRYFCFTLAKYRCSHCSHFWQKVLMDFNLEQHCRSCNNIVHPFEWVIVFSIFENCSVFNRNRFIQGTNSTTINSDLAATHGSTLDFETHFSHYYYRQFNSSKIKIKQQAQRQAKSQCKIQFFKMLPSFIDKDHVTHLR